MQKTRGAKALKDNLLPRIWRTSVVEGLCGGFVFESLERVNVCVVRGSVLVMWLGGCARTLAGFLTKKVITSRLSWLEKLPRFCAANEQGRRPRLVATCTWQPQAERHF